RTVDDTPYGGGAGMVMRPDVVAASIRHARKHTPDAPVVYLCPQGERLTQPLARELAQGNGLIVLCGHYEGIDERVLETDVDRRISLGDFVLTGGEVAVFPFLDAIVRLRAGVLGAEASLHEESFDILDEHGQPLLEYPHYTRPPVWEGRPVPDVLTSGHHANIEKWRKKMAKRVTLDRGIS
ncbi:MAG: tRNA (guanosine(37)-N1)-methyltransferase TrmD, partial [Alphaproteobacteria bacterium]